MIMDSHEIIELKDGEISSVHGGAAGLIGVAIGVAAMMYTAFRNGYEDGRADKAK